VHDKIFAVAHYADQGVLYLLVILSVISLALILERWFTLRKISQESVKMRSRIRTAIATNSPEDIEKLGQDPETLEGRAISMGMKHIRDNGNAGLEEVFNSYTLNERPELEKSLNFLATVGSNAPYIGLLGTVLGIMKAFQDLSASTEAGQQTVMAGISVALVATAAGLFVAIPAVISYNYFQRQVRGILQNLESIKELAIAYAKKKGKA
jgi:biopolymer transport protein TolQ